MSIIDCCILQLILGFQGCLIVLPLVVILILLGLLVTFLSQGSFVVGFGIVTSGTFFHCSGELSVCKKLQ